MKATVPDRQSKLARVARKTVLDYRKERKFIRENPNWDYKLFQALLNMHGECLTPEELESAGKLASDYLESGKSTSELIHQWKQ